MQVNSRAVHRADPEPSPVPAVVDVAPGTRWPMAGRAAAGNGSELDDSRADGPGGTGGAVFHRGVLCARHARFPRRSRLRRPQVADNAVSPGEQRCFRNDVDTAILHSCPLSA
jgi:hypothetical protein